MIQVQLERDGHRHCYRYMPGDESDVFMVMANQMVDPAHPLTLEIAAEIGELMINFKAHVYDRVAERIAEDL